MSQKGVQKKRTQASALVQRGETVRHAVMVNSGPYALYLLGPLGVAFLKFRTVALTDAALYVMTQTGMGAAKAVERRLPLGSVAVSTEKGPPLNSMLVIGQEKMRVGMPFKDEAERLAAAASAR